MNMCSHLPTFKANRDARRLVALATNKLINRSRTSTKRGPRKSGACPGHCSLFVAEEEDM